MIDNLLPENEQFLPNDTDMNDNMITFNNMALTWFVACEAESFDIENSSISAEPTIPVRTRARVRIFSSS